MRQRSSNPTPFKAQDVQRLSDAYFTWQLVKKAFPPVNDQAVFANQLFKEPVYFSPLRQLAVYQKQPLANAGIEQTVRSHLRRTLDPIGKRFVKSFNCTVSLQPRRGAFVAHSLNQGWV
ncbi:hypothetical protein [Pseudomonas prosekii]|uniref:hypothetical protein n=1 Tax=Pseudomonas prosekii TaxID=1148509 RepID=UPI0011EB0190|nr:hypothetical protein [Pseudomonas prosekii]